METEELLELAYRVGRLPAEQRRLFLKVVMRAESEGEAVVTGSTPGEWLGVERAAAGAVERCRVALARPAGLAGRPGWSKQDVALVAALLTVQQAGSPSEAFTTTELNEMIARYNQEGRTWKLNVQQLRGLKEKRQVREESGSYPIRFRFTPAGYEAARELVERGDEGR